MDRRSNSYTGGRPNPRGMGNISNVGSPAYSQQSGSGRSEHSNQNSSRGSRRKNRQRFRDETYFSDNMLLARMKQYLEENTQSIQVDFDHMVEYFQTKFRDYSNRKQAALRGLLVRGHDAIMAEFRANADYTSQIPSLLPGSPGTSEDYPEDDDEMMDSYNESANQTNMQLMALYNPRRSSQQMGHEEKEELINISSSDEGSSEAKKVKADPKPIRPLLPPHILSVIRKGDTDVFPTGSINGGAHHSHASTSQPQATVTSANFNPNASFNANANFNANTSFNNNEDRSRKRKMAAGAEGRKVPTGSQKKKREVPALSTKVTFKDFGGNPRVLTEVCKLLVHMRHPEVYRQIGVSPPRGFLLHGPPGCGKTLLAHAIAGELQVPLIKVASPELVAGVSGESEERVRELFAQAVAAAPCVLFLDEVDAVTPNRHTAQREMERRIVAQLLSSLDELGQTEFGDQVLVIGATNRPDSIDPALRRAGRFDREVCLGIPDLAARRQILEVVCSKLRLAPGLSFDEIARNTPGYVGADLMALTREAAMAAVNRVFGDLKRASAAEKLAKKLAKKQAEIEAKKQAEIAAEKLAKKQAEIAAEKAEKLAAKAVEEVILVADEPKGKQVEGGDKVDVVDVEIDDSTKTVENGKPKENAKMDVCEVVGDNSDCIVLDETPEGNAKPKDAAAQGKESVAKDDTAEKTEKKKDEEKNGEEKMDTEVLEPVAEAKEETGASKKETNDLASEVEINGLKEELMEAETDVVGSCPEKPPVDSGGSGPDLADLISWLHDVAPLTRAQLERLHVERCDFDLALKAVQPSAKREGFATVPDVTWDDVGALSDIRDELQMAILAPVKHAEQFAALGLTTPTGVLLCGPPGCGKTFLAKAVANEAGINFISVKGPELLNMYVGESERAVRQCFQRARNSAPCVIFFDELDALCPKRSDSGEGGASMRVVNQMLTEMDGVEGRKDVYLMAATNRPDIVDPAVLRPGRLDKILYVGMPSGPDRVLILQALTKSGSKPTLCPGVSLARIGACKQTDGYTGADLAALVREAAMQALREHLAGGLDGVLAVADKHFDQALAKIRPSVSEKDRKHYEKLREIYTAVPSGKSSQ